MMGRKADKLTTAQREFAVYTMLLDGYANEHILQNASQQWGLTERQVHTYLQRARARITEAAARHRETAFDDHLLARRELRRGEQDKRLKLDILKDEAKLLGLYAPTKYDVDVNLKEASDEELEKLAR